jgi:7-cyano-7-deazaguanine reductase
MMPEEHRNRFLGSLEEASPNSFAALSSQGSGHYVGLETFDNPGCVLVSYTSDEVVAKCPITGQPDYYVCEITLQEPEKLIESKSLKIWFNNIHESTFTKDFGIFCEGLAVYIREQIAEATDTDESKVRVTLTQKSRGGISIKAIA